MPTIPKFYAEIGLDGKITLEKEKIQRRYLSSLMYKGKPTKIEITYRRYRKKRTHAQNRTYWMWLHFIANEIGETEPENLHVTFKAMFLVDISNPKLPIIKSTTSLNSKEFMDYMDKISVKMAGMGIALPDPEEWKYQQNI